ncbi:MAG: glycosyltransferase [Azospirillaceae bacterium]|nr:glycosyltransferase [Azospirillaceae bacterium]
MTAEALLDDVQNRHLRTDTADVGGNFITNCDEENPLISVVIPHYNDLGNLDRCLTDLAGQTVPATRYELIVADNNSSCGLSAVQERCGNRARAIAAPIQGAGAARNAGVAVARGRFLAFTDSDCRPAPDWLAQGLAALACHDLCGGRVDVSTGDTARLTPVEAFELVFAFNNKHYVIDKGFSVTANLFVSRKTFDAVGSFRDAVSEDLDWCLRAKAQGFAIGYTAEAAVAHPARRTWNELTRKWRRLVREAYALAREQRFGRLRWFLRSWLVLVSPLAHSVTIMQSPRLHSNGNRFAALGILFRLRAWRFAESCRVMVE